MSCLHELAKTLEHEPDRTHVKTVDLARSTTAQLDDLQLHNKFYNLPPIDPMLQEKKPWKQDVNYFKKTYISSLALMKMCIHAQLGGSIEIMGMLIGKIVGTSIVVMDVYRLPVEGTETRVNAQNEAYEYMVRYLEDNQRLGKREENIVGWYHSHPGYGCWLSGIDVSTQSLNQGFQDPYLAIVVDPVRTLKSGKVDIGAFRTYPENHKPNKDGGSGGSKKVGNLPKSKRKDFGSYSDKYYSLDIEIFTSALDDRVVDLLKDEDSLSWMKNLLSHGNEVMGIKEKDIKSIELIKNYELSQDNAEDDNIFTLIEQLKKLNGFKATANKLNSRKFDANFESVLYKKLLKKSKKTRKAKKEVEILDDEIIDESDLEKNADLKQGGAGTVSDADDMTSKDGDEDDDDDYDEEEEANQEQEEEEEEGDEDMTDAGQEDDRLLREVGDLEGYNLSEALDNDAVPYEDSSRMRRRMELHSRGYDQYKKFLPREIKFSKLQERSAHDFIKPSSSSNVGRRRRERSHRGGVPGDQSSFDERLGANSGMAKDMKKKNQNLVKLAKSIGLNEVYDLITLETQEKLFT
ncbi:COP9 signalosome complex subunit 5 [Candida viswanathii]|uniref:COP9 signalosome complex subunit 5 n=1 Tax=Candida viswanathii TaxID=5486 RepID=A0A367XZT9_9ASCO|nr:COP9 signalosome complex subunit 5 [Candida viswanathii]